MISYKKKDNKKVLYIILYNIVCHGLLALRKFLAQFSLDLRHFLLQGFEAGTYTVKCGLELFDGKFCSTFVQLLRIDLIDQALYETVFLVCSHILTIDLFSKIFAAVHNNIV